MFQHANLVEIECDAPAYWVVQGCREAGLRSPEDVRWCHLSRRKEPFLDRVWNWLYGATPGEGNCSCGAALPPWRYVLFTRGTGKRLAYCLGQCRRCGTVYWEDLAPAEMPS